MVTPARNKANGIWSTLTGSVHMAKLTLRGLLLVFVSIACESGCNRSTTNPNTSLGSLAESRLAVFTVRATRSAEEYVMREGDTEHARTIIRSLLPAKIIDATQRPKQFDYTIHIHSGKDAVDIPVKVGEKSLIFVFDDLVCDGGDSLVFKSEVAAAMRAKQSP